MGIEQEEVDGREWMKRGKMMDEGWWGEEEKRSSCDDGIFGGETAEVQRS